MQHLPPDSAEIAAEQGWNEESIIIHLAGFIQRMGLETQLTDYLVDVAAEENQDDALHGGR